MHSMIGFEKLRKLCLALPFVLAGTLPLYGHAADAPQTPCDPQIMQAMEGRAWLEAQREITQNENLIVKPDSVLEYSCFIGFLNSAAQNWAGTGGTDRQFSETQVWQTIGFTQTTTDDSLTNVVASALSTYIDGNFPHKFLGGRLTIPAEKSDTTGHTSGLDKVVGGKYAPCDKMARVWEQAKCQNFDSIAQDDGFRDFNWYADQNNDPRKRPKELKWCKDLNTTAMGNPLGDTYNLTLKEAFNGNQAMYVIPENDDKDPDNQLYKTDDVKTYFDLILPDSCSGQPIPTGLKTTHANGSTDDSICPNPGCSFIGGSCQ